MNIKKIAAISALPVMVLVLSGCGAKPAAQTPAITQPVATTPTAPTTTPAAPTTTSAPAKQALPPLPTNTKAAIDTEVKNIDKELQAADAAIAKDTADSSLGL